MQTPSETLFDQLLVGVAEDARSDHAVRVALRLAERWALPLELVHAVETKRAGWGRLGTLRAGAGTAESLVHGRDTVGAHLREELGDASLAGKPLDALLRILPGHPAQALIQRAGESGRALLVLGPHRRRGVLDFGSTARAIFAKSQCPVWIQSEEPRDVESLLLPIDLVEDDDEALGLGGGLARALGARVTVLNCFQAPAFAYSGAHAGGHPTYVVDDLRRATRSAFERTVDGHEWAGVEVTKLFLEGDPAAEILARQDDFDLIVMGTHGRTRLSSAVLGSTAYQVLRDARTPVVAFRDDRKEWLL